MIARRVEIRAKRLGFDRQRQLPLALRAERIVDRFQPARLIVEVAEIVLHKGDEPDPLAHLPDADVLAREHVTETDLASLAADTATVRHGGRPVVKGIAGVLRRTSRAIRATTSIAELVRRAVT